MKVIKLKIQDFFIIRFKKNFDTRGEFYRNFSSNVKINKKIFSLKQINFSKNLKKGTLRGFHYQDLPLTENKIITVVTGAIYNVTIDLRKKSKTFKKKIFLNIGDKDTFCIHVPAGCANAFLTLKDNTIVQYSMSEYFEKINQSKLKGFKYNDPMFNVKFPFKPKIISKKDSTYKDFTTQDFIK